MINLKLNVVYADGRTDEVKTGPRTQVEFERNFDLGLVEAFQNEAKMRLEWLYFLAWHASKVSHKTAAEFDDWLSTLAEIEVVGSEEPVPSSAAPSTI